MTLGLHDVFEGPAPADLPTLVDPREALLAAEAQLGDLAAQVSAIAEREGLGDYGRFRLAVLAVDQLPIEISDERDFRSPAAALHRGAWSARSRLLAVGAVMRLLGYGAVPHAHPDGSLTLGLPSGDDPSALNSNVVKISARLRRGRGAPESIRLRHLMWDGEGRLGGPKAGGTMVLPLVELVRGPSAELHLAQRKIPAFTLRHPEPQLWPVHAHDDLVLTWHQHPDARDWLALYPALSFPLQVRHALDELATMDLAPSLGPVRERATNDRDLVEILLRSVQSHIRYEEGPLRDLFQILTDRTGDCDQLSLVMVALLTACGFELSDLRALEWPGHLALALRLRDDSPVDGVTLTLDGQRFTTLDAAFLHQTGEELTSSWGQLHPRYARLRASAKGLG